MRLRLLPPDSPVGWTPFAWLVYVSIFLFYGYLGNTPGEWVLDSIALAAFLVLYFRGFWVGGTALLRIALAIVGIAVIVTPHNPGGSCFFIYAAAFAGEIAPPARAIRWIAVIVGTVALQTLLFDLPPHSYLPAVVFSTGRKAWSMAPVSRASTTSAKVGNPVKTMRSRDFEKNFCAARWL